EARDAQSRAEADRKQAEADRDRAKTAETEANAARLQATTDAAIAQAVNACLQEDLLRQVDSAPPDWHSGENRLITVKEALDRAAARIEQRLRDQPLVEAGIRMAIGIGYQSLNDIPQAVPHLERALEIRKAHLGPDHSDTRESMAQLAGEYSWLARHSESI